MLTIPLPPTCEREMARQQLPGNIFDKQCLAPSGICFVSTVKCLKSSHRVSIPIEGQGKPRNFSAPVIRASDWPFVKLIGNAFKMLRSTNIELLGYIVVQKENVAYITEGAIESDFGRRLTLQLISNRIDSATRAAKRSDEVTVGNQRFYANGLATAVGDIKYEVQFAIKKDFGDPGAFLVRSEHREPFLLKSFVLRMPDKRTIVFPCNTWVSHRSTYKSERVFFTNKAYLPVETPPGLKALRKSELASRRGFGIGTRKKGESIYDYDVYNDLGNPDSSPELLRPVLGGSKQFPYPRRCRTGRRPTNADTSFEVLPSSSDDVYLPAGEMPAFPKGHGPSDDSIEAMAYKLIPQIHTVYASKPGFETFCELERLFTEGLNLKPSSNGEETGTGNGCYLKYPLPQVIQADSKAWMLDNEFSRQVIAGLNPLVIERLKVFPPQSKLYPLQKSLLTQEHIGHQLEGFTVEEALERNRLFVLDYYDAYMPYLKKINSQEGVQAYASRTIFFLEKDGILKPVAIELSLPATEQGQNVNRIFLPPSSKKTDWFWELAKAHVATNDAACHQAISHWLRTHAVVEPFVIATHRQLSDMHPIKVLLVPHCKSTLAINSEARRILLCAEGIIERTFFTGKYTMEITSMAYKNSWSFDMQGLPADLLRRGMAVKDPSSKHGLRLTIEDYPYAVDGLDIWASIDSWVDEYVDIFYKFDLSVCADMELQNWWREVVRVGHADKKEGWPHLNSKGTLKEILTTVIWLASAHHAAVNFGQYAYAGYLPNRPTITHRFIPEEGTEDHLELLQNPEKFFCSALATKIEAVTLLCAIELLSSHQPGQDFLGERPSSNWTSDERVLAAFNRFSQRIQAIEEQIEKRNSDPRLKNRRGAVEIPYTLLCPSSKLGLTGRGVPNSISI